MFTVFVTLLPTKGSARACFVLVLLPVTFAFALGSAVGQTLFLLAGTPTADSSLSFPVSLYTVGTHHALKLLRRVVPPEAGLYDVREDLKGDVYVLYPHITPTTVSIIHEQRAAFVDEVNFNPRSLAVDTSALGVAAGGDGESYALLPLLRRPASGSGVSVSLISVAANQVPRQPRVALNQWPLYQSFRYGGAPGGPVGPSFVPLAYIKGNRVRIQVSPPGRPFDQAPSTQETSLAPAPPALSPDERSGPFYIVAASDRFLAIGSTPGHSRVYVYDRNSGAWSEVQSSSTIAYARRIFGPWLSTIVEVWRPGASENANNRGRENERAWGTGLLPNVRKGYAFGQGRDNYIPGTLILDNLVDRGRITIHTNEEDSEILNVTADGLVLYRVNDEIFSAQIEGDKLGPSTLVVEGDDVPEVHWVFWSKASPDVPSFVKPSTNH